MQSRGSTLAIYCLFSFLKLINEPFYPPQKEFLFNYLNFPPQAVCLSAASASASCSAELPSISPRQLQVGPGLELLSGGADSTSLLQLWQKLSPSWVNEKKFKRRKTLNKQVTGGTLREDVTSKFVFELSLI